MSCLRLLSKNLSFKMQDIWLKTKQALDSKNISFEDILEVTKRCNLNCCHCYNVKDNAELSFSQIKEIAGQLREAGCLFYAF